MTTTFKSIFDNYHEANDTAPPVSQPTGAKENTPKKIPAEIVKTVGNEVFRFIPSEVNS